MSGGGPAWLQVAGLLLTLVGAGGGLGALFLVRVNRRKVSVDADEVFTRVAITLVEPLNERLAAAEQALSIERQRSAEHRAAADREIEALRARIREAQNEADEAYRASYRLRTLVQQWHRAIMSPQATLDWLRELVGPTEPAV
ncbi:hypothetical protein [Micromonospora sp. NPDC049645]|uniref:hypothetical protein n=1 Tax=Micromonospora sp. NPDC049645 TaxID=3155508 RepID=UPI00343C3399